MNFYAIPFGKVLLYNIFLIFFGVNKFKFDKL